MMKRKLLSLLLAGCSMATVQAQSIYMARQYYEQGRYLDAAKQLRPLADGGNAEAQSMAARLFFEGKGVQRNVTQGVKYAQMALKQGYSVPADVKAALAECYMKGTGTAKNETRAWNLVKNTVYLEKFTKTYPTQWNTYVAAHPEAKTLLGSSFSVDSSDNAANRLPSENDGLSRAKTHEEARAAEYEAKVFDVVEVMPEFPGGHNALYAWLSNNIKYPPVAEKNGIQGRVICSVVVEREGSITDVRVVRSVDVSLDKEAVRVLKAMPKWIPGKQNGKAVRVKYTIPVTFKLQS